jgi:hypothetical protein
VATPPAAGAAEDAGQEVLKAVDRFVSALASGDAAKVRLAYPGLRGDEPWLEFPTAHARDGLRVAYTEVLDGYPEITGDAAEVRFMVSLTYTGNPGPPRPLALLARFERGSPGWRLAEVRYY